MMDRGWRLIALAEGDENCHALERAGIAVLDVPMDSHGMNPITDSITFRTFLHHLRREKVGMFLGFTAKPNIYGGLAARILRVPRIHNVAGLGLGFSRGRSLRVLMKTLYRQGLRDAAKVFFQNKDDMELFLANGVVEGRTAERLPGSGVDLSYFTPANVVASGAAEGAFRFILSARLLPEKGVREYVEACRVLQAEGYDIECVIMGFLSGARSKAITHRELSTWVTEGVVRYEGCTDDVRSALATSDCIVLPSYYPEGTPRSLLEAAAMSLPIITTDTSGCREAVDDGMTGLLCRPRDVEGLARCMREMINMPREARIAMGQRGRAKMQREFDERIVIDRYLQTVTELLEAGARC